MICSPHGPGIGMMGGSIGLMPTLPPVRFALRPDQDGATQDGRQGEREVAQVPEHDPDDLAEA